MADQPDARKAIEQKIHGFMDACREGDAESLAALYSRDAVLLPPGSAETSGSDDIRTFWQGVFDLGVKEVDLEVRELEIFGERACEVGRFTLKGADGQPLDSGKYLVLWKREDGAWRLHRDIWNSSGGK